MRKTARTVVWEGAGAQSPAPDPITDNSRMHHLALVRQPGLALILHNRNSLPMHRISRNNVLIAGWGASAIAGFFLCAVGPAAAEANAGLAGTATPVENLNVLKDFRVETLQAVPGSEQGPRFSPQGRRIVWDLYGTLFRLSPPAPGPTGPLGIETT